MRNADEAISESEWAEARVWLLYASTVSALAYKDEASKDRREFLEAMRAGGDEE